MFDPPPADMNLKMKFLQNISDIWELPTPPQILVRRSHSCNSHSPLPHVAGNL